MQWIILDRDGVINEDSDAHIKSPEEWEPIEGSLEAIARLTRAGWRVAVVSNQSGLARGLFTPDDLVRIQDKMRHQLDEVGGAVDAFLFCPHGPDEGCTCRKPAPGLLLDLAQRLGIDLTGVPLVGDSLRDVQAARAVGAHPILVRTGKGARTVEHSAAELSGVPIYRDLAETVDALLGPGGAQPA